MKSDIEPITIIDFRHMPFRYYQKNFKIYFTATDPEISGRKAKRLVRELEFKLKNFKKEWGTISCSLSLLSEFSCAQIHGKRIDGGWSSVHFHCSDSSKVDNVRRRNFEKAGALIANEIKSWKFQHYKTILYAKGEPK